MRPLFRIPSNQINPPNPVESQGYSKRKRKPPSYLGEYYVPDNKDAGSANKNMYPYWRGLLIYRWGKYCAYCEMPIGTSGQVEHKRPKSNLENPYLVTEWDNMLLACPRCNQRKSNNYNENVGYAWPDNSNQNEFNAVFNLSNSDKSSYSYIQTADPVTIQLVTGKTIIQPNLRSTKLVLVVAGGNTSQEQTQASNMIQLLKLNAGYDQSGVLKIDQKSSDQMIVHRSQAWLYAESAVERLNTIYETFPDNSFIHNVTKRQILTTAVTTGFWSVWMTVFYNALTYGELGSHLPSNYHDSYSEFLEDFFVTGLINTQLSFPNTDIQRLTY